jgi:hypothetical protein
MNEKKHRKIEKSDFWHKHYIKQEGFYREHCEFLQKQRSIYADKYKKIANKFARRAALADPKAV